MPQSPFRRALSSLITPYRGLGPSLWSMFFATMINRFGDFVGFFLSLYLSRVLGLDAARTGLVVALASGVSTLGSLVSGRIADGFGRKRTLVACQLAAAAFDLATSFLFRESWAPLLIVGAGFFRGGARPLIAAVLTDLAPEERRREVFGLQYWSINVGVALGPLLAAFLFERSLPWLFRGDAVAGLCSAVLIGRGALMPAGARTVGLLERHDERGALRAFLARPILVAFGFVAALSHLSYSQTAFALPLAVSSALGAGGPRFSGYLISLNAAIVIALSIPIARLLRRWTPLSCMAVSGLFYVAGFGLLALPRAPWLFLLSTAVWTLGEIVAAVNLGVFIARHSPANWRASFQSMIGLFWSGGWALGPLLGGLAIVRFGQSALWLGAAALCAVWAYAALRLDAWDRRIGAE